MAALNEINGSSAVDTWMKRYRQPVRVPLRSAGAAVSNEPASPVADAPAAWMLLETTQVHEERDRLRTEAEEQQEWRRCAQGAAEISALSEMLVQIVESDAEKLQYAARKNEQTADAFERGHECLADAQRRRVKAWAWKAGWTGAAAGAGIGLLVGGPVGIAVGGIGAWLAGGVAVGSSVVGVTGALTARAIERRSLRTIDEAVRKVREQRERVSADGRLLDAQHTEQREAALTDPVARSADVWLDSTVQGQVAQQLANAADMAYIVHEQLCADYRTILQNRQLVEFHEYVESMSDQLLAIDFLRPQGKRAAGPPVDLLPPVMPHELPDTAAAADRAGPATHSPEAVHEHISALLHELKGVHRGIGQLLDGQLGQLDAVLDATTNCTVRATSLVKAIVNLHDRSASVLS